MAGQYQRKKSNAANWCYRLALFALLYFIMVIILHRFGWVSTPQGFWLITAGLIMVATSLILAFKAVSDLWNKGYKGGGKTIRGIVLSVGMLLPFGYYVYLGLSLPLLNDVSTDVFDPPEFIKAQILREEQFSDGIAELSDYDPQYGEQIILSYPRLGARRYPADTERVFQAVINTIRALGWRITAEENPPKPTDDKGVDVIDADKAEAGADEELDGAAESDEGDADIFVEAVTSTFVMGYKADVVVRISNVNNNTLVNMRSASRWGRHDFGNNAKQIRNFMEKLDENLLGLAGEDTQ